MRITFNHSCNLWFLCLLFIAILINNSTYATTHIPAGNQSGTWTKANSPYILDGSVTVASGSTLTIQSGVTVIFPSYYIGLTVSGTLNAQGTSTDSIRFKGQADANYSTKYGGSINLYSSSTIMKYISTDSLGDLSNGQSSIYLNTYDTLTPTITNVSIKHSGGMDIYCWAGGAKNMSNINGVITIAAGSILGNATMPKTGGNSYYNLYGSVNVDAGKTLTIKPGAIVIFPSYSVSLTVNGTLNAQGSSIDSILFKGKANSTYSTKFGGSVNLYSSTTTMSYVSLDSMGDPSNGQGSIYINTYDTITPTITNTTVKHSGSLDIYCWAGGAKNISNINGIINIAGGSIPGNAMMPKVGGNTYYNLLGSLTVDAGKTLTVQPGVTVIFPLYSTSLTVNGALNAQGTLTDSIRFKGQASSYYNTKYGGAINLYTSSATMNYVSTDSLGDPNSGQGTIYINTYDSITPAITNTSVKHSGGMDIYTWAGGAKNLSNINGVINIAAGSIPGNATMPKVGGNTYYILLGSVTVDAGKTLNINSGVVITFPSYSVSLTVNGTLNAQGTTSDSIRFKGQANPYYSTKYGGSINLYTSSTTMSYVSLDSLGDPNSGQGSIYINTYDSIIPVITNTSIKHSGGYDIYTWAGGALNMSNINGIINVAAGSIPGNAIMPKVSGNTYYNLVGQVTVDARKLLTIQPGVTVVFPSYYTNLNVNGTLYAQGTVADSVRFKGKADPNYSYKYGGYIYLSSSSTIMNYVSIDSLDDPSSGGPGSIYIYNYDTLTPTITNTSIRHSGSMDIYTWAGGAKNLLNINGIISIAPGSIPGNAMMPKVGGTSYYKLTGTTTIDAGKTLTIQPGVIIQFPSSYTDLTINGTLNARGTISDTIRFKGTRDVVNNTLYGGSINLNADGSNLSFISVDSMSGNNSGAVMASAGFSMNYASIRNSKNDGVSIYSPKASISYTNITKNTTGVGVYYCKAVINNCNIYSNTSYGINNVSLTALTDATLNYWGTTSGPYHPTLNKKGTGNKVSDSVNFQPFKTTIVLPTLPYISTFSPAAAATDTVIKITGLRFTGATKVLFGNTAAKSFTVINDSTISAVVDAGSSGYVKVTTAQGSDSLGGLIYCSGVALHADFTYTSLQFDVYFTNTSTDATSYVWNFGDGDTTSVMSPSHKYDTAGTYTVCLSDTNVCAKRAETVCKMVVVYGLAFTDDDKDGLNDYTETAQYGTATGNFDTNGDWLGDGPNVFTGLSALSADTDDDGISNLQELINGTNPVLADTDGDGVNDKLDPFPLDRYRSKLPAKNTSDHIAPTISVSEPF